MVLFGLSQIANTQNFLKGFDYEKTEKYLNAMEVVKTTPPLYSVTVKYGERNLYFQWDEILSNRDGCSFDVKVDVYCDFNVLTVINCSDCQTICWNGTMYQNSFLVMSTGTYTVTVFGPNCQSQANVNVIKVGNKPEFSVVPVNVCPGDKGTLTVVPLSGPLTSFAWSNGATTSIIQVPKGMYSVTATNAQGCANVVQAEISEFLLSPAPVVSTTFTDGLATLTSPVNSGNMWVHVETGTVFSNSKSITPEIWGNYVLKTKDANGCYSAPSCEKTVSVKTKTVTVVVHDTVIVNSPLSCPLKASFFAEVVSGRKISLENTSSGSDGTALINWGDGNVEVTSDFLKMHEYAVDGIYEITLNAFSGAEQSVFQGSITINTKTGNGGNGNCPTVAGFNFTIEDKKVTFTNKSSGSEIASYIWTFGTEGTSTQVHPMFTFKEYKDYNVTLYLKDVNGKIIGQVSQIVSLQNVLQPCKREGITIKGKGDGAFFLPGELTSQTLAERSFQLPGYLDNPRWSTGRVDPDNTPLFSYANPGQHELYFRYKYQNKEYCHVIGYIVGGGLNTSTSTENRSSDIDLDFEIYPNPTSDFLNISVPEGIREHQLILVNELSMTIYSSDKVGEHEIDLQNQPLGLYIAYLMNKKNGEIIFSKKVIKQ